MILAGIDEAGLGPTLGPLTTASTAFRFTAATDNPAVLWEMLAAAVADRWRRAEKRPVVADSKEVYSRGGITALELSLGAFCRLLGDGEGAGPEVTAGDADGTVPHPCYSLSLAPFPIHCDLAAIAAAAAGLNAALTAANAAIIHLETRSLSEPAMNSRFVGGMNKNQVLLRETGWHISRLLNGFPDQPMLIMVDKQGGRNSYLPFLTALLPGLWIDELRAGNELSSYRLRRNGNTVEIRFRAKADRESFPTALASLAAKYARERAMAEFNAWFGTKVPTVKATAGYPGDARRWLAEIRAAAPDHAALHLEQVIRLR